MKKHPHRVDARLTLEANHQAQYNKPQAVKIIAFAKTDKLIW